MTGTTVSDSSATSKKADELNHNAIACKAAAERAKRAQDLQYNRLKECIGKELGFRAGKNPNGSVVVAQRKPTLEGHRDEEWRAGSSLSVGTRISDDVEFTATVLRAGINDCGGSYLVVAVGQATRVVHPVRGETELLYPDIEYRLLLSKIKVISGLD